MLKNRFITGRASAAVGFGLLFGIVALPAQAVPVFEISAVTGTWTSATTTPSGGVSGSQIGTNLISWGDPATPGGAQSSFQFNGNAPAFVNPNVAFELGTFTHSNQPIFLAGPLLTAATLKVVFEGKADGNPFSATSVFNLTHNETPNACSSGANCSDDIVTFVTNPSATTSVLIANVLYSFTFTGFDYGGSPLTQFFTKEGQLNFAKLYGSFTSSSSIPSVPIPGALPLFASGLAGLGLLAWRRKRKAAAAAD